VGFLTGARRAAKEFGEGLQEGFEVRQQYHANKAAGMPQPSPETQAQDNLNNHIRELVAHKAKRGFGINTAEANNNLGKLLENPNFAHDVEFDTRINKYVVQADPNNENIGRQVVDNIGKGVPAAQFNTQQLGLAKGVLENDKIADRLRRKQEIAFGLHPNGINNSQDLANLRDRSDYQNINLEDKVEFNRAQNIVNGVHRGEIDVQQIGDTDLKRAEIVERSGRAKANARLIRRRELSRAEFDSMDPKLQEETLSKVNADNIAMDNLGMQMWNKSNPNDNVSLEEYSARRLANENEGRQMAGNKMVGAGEFGFVFENDPRSVIKQEAPVSVAWNSGVGPGTGMNEIANLHDLQGAPGVPKLLGAQQLNDGTTRIAMPDLRDNYEVYGERFGSSPYGDEHGTWGSDPATDIKRFQQLGGINLRGIDLNDRHENNVMVHSLTGRPMQVDFGIGQQLNNSRSKAVALSKNTQKGFYSAGLEDEGDLLNGLVSDLIQEGQDDEAYKMAKQGFAQLQKIKKPVNAKRASQLV